MPRHADQVQELPHLVPQVHLLLVQLAQPEGESQLGAEAFVYFRVPGVDLLETADRPIELVGALCARIDPRLRLEPGDPVWVAIDPEHARLFDPQTGAALTPAR